MNEQRWRDVVSGREQGTWAAAARSALAALELPYAAAVAWRNRRFDQAHHATRRVAVPVISVGNLTVGGTGKTPLVCAVAEWYRERGVRVAIVSRGYKSDQASAGNDEAAELRERLPDVPQVQRPDRVAGAEEAIGRFGAQLIVLDDGFQHRRLARDLDIVVIDALNPFGYRHLLPRGMLREPLESARRADLMVLSRAELVEIDRREAIRREFQRLEVAAPWVESAQRPTGWWTLGGHKLPLDQPAIGRAAAFCGLGNPDAFFGSLATIGIDVACRTLFPDHHRYTRDDLEQLVRAARAAGADALVCTHKDLVKFDPAWLAATENCPKLLALRIDVALIAGQTEWDTTLQRLLNRVTGERAT